MHSFKKDSDKADLVRYILFCWRCVDVYRRTGCLQFFFALSSLFRFSVITGVFDRPIFIGLLWALFCGHWPFVLGCAIFFELIWLDLFPVGTVIPAHRIISTFYVLSMAHFFGIRTPSQALPLIFISFVCSWLGTKLEDGVRWVHNRSYEQLTSRVRQGQSALNIEQIVAWGVFHTFAAHFVLFWVICILSVFFLPYLYFFWPAALPVISWPLLWLAALVGAVISLRIQQAQLAFALCLGLVIFWIFLTRTIMPQQPILLGNFSW